VRASSPRMILGERRLRTAAALTLAGAGLMLAAAASASGHWSQSPYIERHPETERVLPPPDARAVSTAVAATATSATRRSPQKQLPIPVRISVPAIGVRAPLIPLGLNRDGTAEVPKSFSVAGWFRPGPEPGERGAAVILGHVDSKSGPGVFYHLKALRRGDRIRIRLVNRKTIQFVVTGSMEAPKNHFPTRIVFAHTSVPTLRLVTCGGGFNYATGHYLDNYIVFARLVGRA
jgi:sortase (surface protein transpeptidase)